MVCGRELVPGFGCLITSYHTLSHVPEGSLTKTLGFLKGVLTNDSTATNIDRASRSFAKTGSRSVLEYLKERVQIFENSLLMDYF